MGGEGTRGRKCNGGKRVEKKLKRREETDEGVGR